MSLKNNCNDKCQFKLKQTSNFVKFDSIELELPFSSHLWILISPIKANINSQSSDVMTRWTATSRYITLTIVY